MDDTDQFLPDDADGPAKDPAIADDLKALADAAANTVAARIGPIQMVSISSSDISEWGYDPIGSRLQIHFTNNRIYIYSNVSAVDFEQLTTAPSKGSAFWQMIRRNPAQYPWERIQ